MKTKRLVLFDIDGTILKGGKLWRECLEGAFGHCFPGVKFPHVSYSGKTDRLICMELFDGAGLACGADSRERDGLIDLALREYLSRVKTEISRGRSVEVELLPGVTAAVEALASIPEIRLGLLTGNLREGAELKLSAVELTHRFDFDSAAFGDDHWNRSELPTIAVNRTRARHGTHYLGKEVVIIGDTVHDVTCGRSIGVRAIAVGTGRPEHRSEILAARPDFFFDTLEKTRDLVEAIVCELPSR